MTRGQQRSLYEQQLALASKRLLIASQIAEHIGDEGAMDDALQLRTEISRLMEDSVSGRKRKRRQLSLLQNDRA